MMMRPELPYDLTCAICQKALISGLSDFKNGLEKQFFAAAEVRFSHSVNGKGQLILELRCPLPFIEALYHFKQGTWGVSSTLGTPASLNTGLSALMEQLNSRNEEAFEISEITLEFTDMLLVLQPAGLQPLHSVLPTLIEQLSRHYIALSHGMQTPPEEIYIPVAPFASDAGQPTWPDAGSPYRFWALYYEDAVEGEVYDSLTGEWIRGDISLVSPTETLPE